MTYMEQFPTAESYVLHQITRNRGSQNCISKAGLIRLAYFNVTEEERQQTEGGGRKCYLGLPITASALVFPLFYLLGLLLPGGPYILAAGMLLLAALYVTPLRIPKPGLAAICLLSAVGALELAGLILAALGRL